MKIKVKQNDTYIIIISLLILLSMMTFKEIYVFLTMFAGPNGLNIAFFGIIIMAVSSIGVKGSWATIMWWFRSILLLISILSLTAYLALITTKGGGAIGESVVYYTINVLRDAGYTDRNITLYSYYKEHFMLIFGMTMITFGGLMFRK